MILGHAAIFVASKPEADSKTFSCGLPYCYAITPKKHAYCTAEEGTGNREQGKLKLDDR
jgi:hypothetical protein